MKYYIQVGTELANQIPIYEGIWQLDGAIIKKISVSNEDSTRFILEEGQDVIAFMNSRFSGTEFHQLQLNPGEYFPSMARPDNSNRREPLGRNPHPDLDNKVRDARARNVGQLHALNVQLEQICRVIHPQGSNLQAYGHEIRNVLILACTEAESYWKAILVANNENEGRSTKDYVKLAGPMKLKEFSVDFPYYPWLDPIKPYENWGTSDSTTKDIEWYDAYNKVKHDRETHFSEATLHRAFQSIAGCFATLCAQHGWAFALKDAAADRAFLRLRQAPTWHPSEVYVQPYLDGRWKRKPFPFTSTQ